MTDQPTTKPDQVRPQEPRTQLGGTPTAPASNLTTGEPVRRDFGDKTDDTSKRPDPSKSNDKSAKGDDDAGEGHKGPRVDATMGSSENRSQADRASASKQQNPPNPVITPAPKAPQSIVHGKSGSDSSTPGKEAESKPVGTHTGGGPKI